MCTRTIDPAMLALRTSQEGDGGGMWVRLVGVVDHWFRGWGDEEVGGVAVGCLSRLFGGGEGEKVGGGGGGVMGMLFLLRW